MTVTDNYPALCLLLEFLEANNWSPRTRVDLCIRDRDGGVTQEMQTTFAPTDVAGEIRGALHRAQQAEAIVSLGREVFQP